MPAACRLSDTNQGTDAHGCPSCPHPVNGFAVSGSSDVLINNRPAFRLGDNGIHAPCCGPNTWNSAMGSMTVNINGKGAIRQGDMTQGCGGVGSMNSGSPNVNIGG